MRKDFLKILRCPLCRSESLDIKNPLMDEFEIREGEVICLDCNTGYKIKDGIVDFLTRPDSTILKEIQAISNEDYFQDIDGKRYKVNRDAIEKFKDAFLSLPEGNGSIFFKKGGCFRSIRDGSHRFYDTLRKMRLGKDDFILSIGDGFGYASYRFAREGSYAVALDIGSYLLAGDIYIKDAYFERIFSDMHMMPFKDSSFDIVFCSAALHHSTHLKDAFLEISRVLKDNGRVYIINESAKGIFENSNSIFDELKKRGYNDTAYTIPEWVRSARIAGFRKVKLEFLSIADDYIVRHDDGHKNEKKLSLRFAYFLKRHRYLEKILLLIIRWPRILFRPKSWRMICWK